MRLLARLGWAVVARVSHLFALSLSKLVTFAFGFKGWGWRSVRHLLIVGVSYIVIRI